MKMILTKKGVDELVCTSVHGRELIRDTQCKGLGVEVRSTGGKTYYYFYRDAQGKQRSYKLANAAAISPSQARILCERLRTKLTMGEAIDERKQPSEEALTLERFFTEKYLPYISSYRRTTHADISLYKNHVRQLVGFVKMNAMTHEHILAIMNAASAKLADGTCNLLLALLRYMFNLAIRWKLDAIKENPTAGYNMKKLNNHRERFLSEKETQRLMQSINHSINPMLKYIIPMLLLTGARKREVLDARWEEINIEKQCWRISNSKSGSERYVPLSATVVSLLAKIPKKGDYIFANPKTAKPYVSIYRSWDVVRCHADLKDIRMHDLRHSFASFLVNAGCSLYEVQKLLGHSNSAMTQRYSHLSQASLMRAVSCAEPYLKVD